MKIDNARLRTAGKLAMVAAMILGAVTILGVPAHASSTMDRAGTRTAAAPAIAATTGSTLYHRQSDRCLDGSVSQGVRLKVCNFTAYQQWYSNSPSTVPRTIIHRQSGRCLEAAVSVGVRLGVCNGSAYQIWY
jgi:hypothetical protein